MDTEVEPEIDGNKSSFLRLTIAIIGFTLATVFAMTLADRNSVMAKWPEVRCNLPTMLSAFLYKPSDYNGSAADFAADNFNFCLSGLAGKALSTATQPAVGLIKGQAAATGVVGQLQNSVRNMLGNLHRDFSKNLDGFYMKYRLFQGVSSRLAQYLRASMGKLEGIIGASTYLAISTFVSLMNTVEFIVWVAIIIILILVVIFIILFFFLAPFTPLLLTIIGIITAAGFGTAIGGAASVFCFSPNTPVILADGSLRPISQLSVGTELLDGAKVEGMFIFDGSETPLYDLNGIMVSGTHLVYNAHTKTYMEVASHPDAHLTDNKSKYVYCPITTTRHVPVQNSYGQLTIFCDWEEVSSDEAEAEWATAVASIIGNNPAYNAGPAGFGADAYVYNSLNHAVKITEVNIGDTIYDNGRQVKVLGKVHRFVSDSKISGTWSWDRFAHKWVQNSGPYNANMDLYHLITDSGTFMVKINNRKYIVRDATEVGVQNLRSCTPTVLKSLNSSE
jgi:hypothetical protein